MPRYFIRAMRPDDIDVVLAIQARCYSALEPESAEALLSRLRVSPLTCWVADSFGGVVGYLLSHPWASTSPPPLDMVIDALPTTVDCLYLHDLAVDPLRRSGGTATGLVQAFLQQADREWPRAALTAVQASQLFWQRFGFLPAPTHYSPSPAYGEALLMWREVAAHG